MAPKDQHPQSLAETVATLATTVSTLATTVSTLSDRVQTLEAMLAKFLGNMAKGKWFLFGVAAAIMALVYGVVEAAMKLKGLIKL